MKYPYILFLLFSILALKTTQTSTEKPPHHSKKSKKLSPRELREQQAREQREAMLQRARDEQKIRDEAAAKIMAIEEEAQKKIEALRNAPIIKQEQQAEKAREEAQIKVREDFKALNERTREYRQRIEEVDLQRRSKYSGEEK